MNRSEFCWNQLKRLEDLHHTWRSLFSHSSLGQRRAAHWIPLVDVSKDAEGYVIKAELPQVKKRDLNIVIEDGSLTITGERKFDRNNKTDHPIEHAYGRFSHCFELPADAHPAKISAKFTNGVLIVHLGRNSE